MTPNSGQITKRKPLQDNQPFPDAIETEADLEEFDQMLEEEKAKLPPPTLLLEKDFCMELINKAGTPGQIIKVDEDQHVVYAWASIATVKGEPYHDQQGDTITDAELEKAAHEFVLEVRKAGEMHTRTEGIGKLVASIVFTDQIQKALGIDLGRTGWFTGWKIQDADVWKKIKSGEYGALSIHGRGNREELI
jgi:hypothetical protein